MSENVVALNGGPVQAERKSMFLRTLAEAFDRYIRDHGNEPEALVFVLNGITQTSSIGWHMTGASEAGPTSILALAATHVQAEAAQSRQGA